VIIVTKSYNFVFIKFLLKPMVYFFKSVPKNYFILIVASFLPLQYTKKRAPIKEPSVSHIKK